jgi:GMP synthase-like glutamine amidotransferase
MLPCTQKLSELKFTPKGIILSGGPYSVYEEGSPHVDPAVFDLSKHAPSPAHLRLADCLILDVPILGICCA